MKKLGLLLAVPFLSVQLFAAPAQVTFDALSGAPQFYDESGSYTAENIATDGFYAEIILSASGAAYTAGTMEQFLSYGIAGETKGYYPDGVSTHMTGYAADGSAISTATTKDGQAEVIWQYTDTALNGSYATWRVYNNADKNLATKYLVLNWQKINVTPSETYTAEVLSWNSTDTRDYMKYDVPAVPEPATMALVGLGSLAMVIRRKLRKEA